MTEQLSGNERAVGLGCQVINRQLTVSSVIDVGSER